MISYMCNERRGKTNAKVCVGTITAPMLASDRGDHFGSDQKNQGGEKYEKTSGQHLVIKYL